MSNVLPFRDSVPPTEPYGDLVAALETLLARAKSGDLRAMAYATVDGSKVIGTGWDGADGTRYPLAGAVMILNARYAEALRG